MKAKEVKRKEAEARNAAWAKLVATAQLAYLDVQGFVATKQRAKIAKKLEK